MTCGAVVVGAEPGQRARLDVDLAARGAIVVDVRPQSPDRVIVEAWAAEPAATVRALRAAGHAATVGPANEGARVGWRNRTSPTWFGPGACVCLPWSEFDREAATVVVEIDPGGGFGAGAHPSTRLLLEFMARQLQPGDRVLDVGTGSGVLAVTAACLGAGDVTAIDIDPAAIAATRANAVRNDVAERVSADQRPLDALTGSYDVVVANIHAPVLIELAPELRRLLTPQGRLAMSGLSPAQESLVGAAIRPLEITGRFRRDDWIAVVAGIGRS